MITVDHLRRFALARSLFRPTSLGRAIERLGFVQADPIRAPARAQDLTLRHRVRDYRAGDLERRYRRLPIEEDFFVNYGFLPRRHHELMHPRTPHKPWTAARREQALQVLAYVIERGAVHPREVDAHFAHGKVRNWFGGSSNASTQLLDDMHYRGLLRVAYRDGGTRIYAARPVSGDSGDSGDSGVAGVAGVDGAIGSAGRNRTTAPATAAAAAPATAAALIDVDARLDALIDILANKYAPLPASSLGQLVRYLSGGAPQWAAHKAAALERARRRLAHARIDGIDWYWPGGENPGSRRWRTEERVRLLTPFDPVVWDRRRFEIFWNWTYRFEAYTPPAKRKLGYYALPMLWRERVIGWANVSVADGRMVTRPGYVDGAQPRDAAFRSALDAELQDLSRFLGLEPRQGP